MRNKFFLGAMFLIVASLFVFNQSTTNAAPLAICISTTGGGDWANTGTWQFCTGSNPPASTDDVYIQGPVTMAASQTAANVTLSNGGSLNPGANTLTANSMIIDAGGLFTGSLTLGGNLTDNGSFAGAGQAVTISGATSIGAGATFNCGSNTVTFQGNLTNNGTFDCSSGTANFQGSALQSAGSSSALLFSNLTVNNAMGVTLNQNASVSGILTFTSGDLNTGAYTLTLTGATITGTGGGDVVGNAKRTGLSSGTTYKFNSPNTSINFSALSPSTDVIVNLIKSTPTGFTRTLPRQYTITASGSPVFTATMQLHYKSSEVTGSIVEANLMPWRYNTVSGRWELQPGSGVSSGDNSYVQATGVTGFSLWALSDNGAPTAVTLSTLTANSTQNNPVILGLIGGLILAISGGGWLFRHR